MGLTTKEISSSSFNDMISSVDRRSEYVENRAGANVRLNNFLTPYTLDDKSSILNAPCGYSNGVYPSLRPVQTFGPELIDLTQGTAEQPSQWSNITTNSVNFLPGAAGVRYFNVSSTNGTLISGRKYSLTLEISNYSGSQTLGISTQGNVSHNARLDANGTHSEVFTSDGGLIRIFGRATNSATITVSIKEEIDADFDFTRGSAATRVTKDGLIKNVQILSGELLQNGDFEQIGSELITNGGFDTDSDWVKGTGTTISGGNANFVNATGVSLYQNIGTQSGTVKVEFTVTNYTSGTLNVYSGGNQSVGLVNVSANALGTYTAYVDRNGGNVNIIFGSSDNFTGSIDNVSVKEVGQNWDIGSDWQILDGKLKYNSSTASSSSRQDFNFTSGKKYKIEFEISDFTTDYRFDLYTGVSFIQSAIITSQTSFSYIFEGDGGIYLRFRGLQRGTGFSVDNVSIIEITDDTNLPRIDYTNGTGSLLLEPQRTNLIPYSEDFTQWSASGNIDVPILVSEISPSGESQCGFLNINNAASSTKFNYLVFSTTSNIHTQSVFIKYNSRQWFQFASGGTAYYANFDIQNGVIGNVSACTATIEDYGNGWYKCSITTAIAVAPSNYAIVVIDSGTALRLPNSTGLGSYYVWGAQMEVGDYVSSYIPTSGSTVTRNAEVCNNAGSSNLINSTEGVLYAEIAALADDLTFRSIAISDGTLDNRVLIRYRTTSNKINIFIEGSNVVAVNSIRGLTDITNYSKFALKYKSGDIALWVDGVEIFTDTATFTISGLDRLSFDGGNGSDDFYGNVRSVAVFKEALTDEELAKITSTTQQEVFYEMRDRMLQINADYYEFGDYTTRLKKLF